MKKIFSYVLLVSLVLTIAVSAMPGSQSSSMLNDTQMIESVGGRSLAACAIAGLWGGGMILSAALGGPAGIAAAAYVEGPIAVGAAMSCMF
jgi:hypothetical protein